VRTILEGHGLEAIAEKLRTKWKGTVLAAWKFWPPANVINFAFVKLQYRVLYVNFLSFIWNGYLSYVNSRRVDVVADVVDAGIDSSICESGRKEVTSGTSSS